MEKTAEVPVIWLQAASCSGCSVSILNSAHPRIAELLLDEVIPGRHINLRFQATVMAGAGRSVLEVLEEAEQDLHGRYLLIVEGAIPTAEGGLFGTLGEEPLAERAASLGRAAQAAIALGTCASFGGIFAAAPNPTGCISLGELFKQGGITTPLINLPGCPPHPDWFVGTVVGILLAGLDSLELDEYRRPISFYGKLIHENCPRRAYFDEGKFAKHLSDEGCLYELGCKGPITHADCPLRLWNDGVNWVIGCGAPCNGCVEPGFPDLVSPFYEKLKEG
ncbi:TPA: oxidoreductase [Candidatus Bipolaricaulota bacterium]|nr:oxidoreductase [Candidatus Bipolaricaulota bacterium]